MFHRYCNGKETSLNLIRHQCELGKNLIISYSYFLGFFSVVYFDIRNTVHLHVQFHTFKSTSYNSTTSFHVQKQILNPCEEEEYSNRGNPDPNLILFLQIDYSKLLFFNIPTHCDKLQND